MKSRPLLVLVSASIGVAVATPRHATESSAPQASEPHNSHHNPWSMQSAQSDASEAGSGEVSLPRNGDGHFYAEVAVNGTHSQMLVDTGASVVALTGEDAEAAGLTWEPDEVAEVGQGASGAVYGVHVTLDRVQVGDVEVNGVDAIVVPKGLGVSLLGQSFLGRLDHVDIGKTKMVLGA